MLYIFSFFVLCTIETLYIFLFLDFFTNLFVVRVNIDTYRKEKQKTFLNGNDSIYSCDLGTKIVFESKMGT